MIFVGNVGRDPEVRHLENDRVVANFSLATRETYRDKQGQRQELTEWHTIELWDDLARTAEKYVKKGKLIYLEGKIRTNNWTDKETGQERSSKIIRCNVMTFLNTGTGGGREGADHSGHDAPAMNHSEESGDDLPF